MKYTIRQFHSEQDSAALLSLWRVILQNSTPDRLNRMYRDNSYGRALSWLVIYGSDSTPVGSVSVFPRQVTLGGKEIRLGVNCDMLMLPKHRTLGPALMALRALGKDCSGFGYQLLLAMPNKRSQSVFKRVGYQKIGTALRWGKILRSEDKLSKFVKQKFLQKTGGLCVDWGLRLLSIELWVRLRHFVLWRRCVANRIKIDQIVLPENFNSENVLKKEMDFLKWRYSEDICQGNPVVFSLNFQQHLLGYIIYTLNDQEVIVQEMSFANSEAITAKILLSKFVQAMRSDGYKSISVLHYGPEHFEKILKCLGFMKREGRDLFVSNLVKQDCGALLSSLGKVSWFEGDLDL